MPYDEADPPYLPVPWLNVYDSRDFLSFVAEPLFRRRDGLASVVDLRVHSAKDFPKSHSAYWELPRGLGRDRDRVHLAACGADHRRRRAPARLRGAQGAYPRSVNQIVFFSVYCSNASRPLSRPPKPDSL